MTGTGLVLLFSCIQAQLTREPLSHYLTTPAKQPFLTLSKAFLHCPPSPHGTPGSQWEEDSRALLSQPSKSGTALEKGYKVVSAENCLCADVRGHGSLHMCVQTHLEWGEGMKHHLWNPTRHPPDHRYSSGKFLGELVSLGLFCFLTEQTQGTAPNVKNRQEKMGCGGFVIILHGLVMEKPKQVQILLFFFLTQPMDHHPPSHRSWLFFILSGPWFSYPKVTVPQELAGLPTPFGSFTGIRKAHPCNKGEFPRYTWRGEKSKEIEEDVGLKQTALINKNKII